MNRGWKKGLEFLRPELFALPDSLPVRIGPWLLLELKQADAALRAQFPKDREFRENRIVGLTLRHREAHVVPADDPEADVLMNPSYVADGLGRWPAELYWCGTRGRVRIVVATEETRYWVSGISRGE